MSNTALSQDGDEVQPLIPEFISGDSQKIANLLLDTSNFPQGPSYGMKAIDAFIDDMGRKLKLPRKMVLLEARGILAQQWADNNLNETLASEFIDTKMEDEEPVCRVVGLWQDTTPYVPVTQTTNTTNEQDTTEEIQHVTLVEDQVLVEGEDGTQDVMLEGMTEENTETTEDLGIDPQEDLVLVEEDKKGGSSSDDPQDTL